MEFFSELPPTRQQLEWQQLERLTVMERLIIRSEWQGECLVWTGGTTAYGYGQIRLDGKATTTHRVAWIERHGSIPSETPFVLHSCDNRPCFRDEHLFLGTNADNMRDMAAKGRSRCGHETHCPQGHPYDEENTYVTPDGRRVCRACAREHRRAYDLRQRTRFNDLALHQ